MIPSGLVETLRNRFRTGSTIPDLLACARQDCKEKWLYSYAVQEAFALNSGGWIILDYTESFGNGKYPDRVMDDLFLAEILKRRPRWDVPANEREPAWYDGLGEPPAERDDDPPTSPEGWAVLGDRDRERLLQQRRDAARSRWYNTILGALASYRLRRLNELAEEYQIPRPSGVAA